MGKSDKIYILNYKKIILNSLYQKQIKTYLAY